MAGANDATPPPAAGVARQRACRQRSLVCLQERRRRPATPTASAAVRASHPTPARSFVCLFRLLAESPLSARPLPSAARLLASAPPRAGVLVLARPIARHWAACPMRAPPTERHAELISRCARERPARPALSRASSHVAHGARGPASGRCGPRRCVRSLVSRGLFGCSFNRPVGLSVLPAESFVSACF